MGRHTSRSKWACLPPSSTEALPPKGCLTTHDPDAPYSRYTGNAPHPHDGFGRSMLRTRCAQNLQRALDLLAFLHQPLGLHPSVQTRLLSAWNCLLRSISFDSRRNRQDRFSFSRRRQHVQVHMDIYNCKQHAESGLCRTYILAYARRCRTPRSARGWRSTGYKRSTLGSSVSILFSFPSNSFCIHASMYLSDDRDVSWLDMYQQPTNRRTQLARAVWRDWGQLFSRSQYLHN